MKKTSTHSKKQLIVDCQVFQSTSWHRGMGKYSRWLLDGMLKNAQLVNEYDLCFLFNDRLDSNAEMTELITQLYPTATFINISLEVPKEPRTEYSVAPVIVANKKILDEVIKRDFSGKDVSFLILALYLDEVCSVFPTDIANKVIVYYDSIPYLYHERYGQFKGFFGHFYLPHTATVYEADKILTISKTVANDLHIIFGLPHEKIFDIDGAPISRTKAATKPASTDIEGGNFILLPTGQELRKNNNRAVRAFEQFRAKNDLDIKLVITSFFTDEAKQEMNAVSKHLVFSGNVSEEEILWLYKECKFVFFPSEYEGLGLPVLEAVEQDKPIACSDISVFREMSTTAFNYFDPLNIDSISDTLESLYAKADEPNKEYAAIMKKYTWANSAQMAIDAMVKKSQDGVVKKKKVAIFCPDPAGFSAIGKVVTECHAYYAQYFDITYYFDRGENHQEVRMNPLPFLANCKEAAEFTAAEYIQFDAVIYHIGNSEYHLDTIHTALTFKGYVILHDTYLEGAYNNLIEHGYITEQRLQLERKLDELVGVQGTKTKKPKSSNLVSIINNQHAVITHSEYAKEVVSHKLLDSTVHVKKINLPVSTPMYTDIVRGLSGGINISFAGIIAKIKGTDIIADLAQSQDFEDCNFNIFGYSAVEPGRIEELSILPNVTIHKNPNDYDFQKLMADTDILINVRMAYRGETSLTTLEAMRFGATVVVRDFGWYSELPDELTIKVSNPMQVAHELREMLKDPVQLQANRQKCIDYITTHHSHQQYAEQMYELITSLN